MPRRHSSRVYDQHYSSDSTDPRTRVRHHHAHFTNGHDLHKQYDTRNALVRYRTDGNGYHSNLYSNELARHLVQVFDTFSDTHAIASAQYSANPSTGDYSFAANANLDREQCTICRQWFPDRYKLERHQEEFLYGCEQCGVCLRPDNVAYHATDVKHERCFVRGCESDYRTVGNWRHRYVERHILGRHIQGRHIQESYH